MARYKDYNYDQMKMLPVSYDTQILPGSFEYSLSYLVDNELDQSAFDQQYQNDFTGRPAYGIKWDSSGTDPFSEGAE
ncbi:MAG: hypothetical protein AB2817_01935 [Candidatus Thiodiazotropha sp.]